MRKNLFLWMLLAFGAVTFSSCSKDDDNGDAGGDVQPYCYIVNQGDPRYNNASLQVFDVNSETVSSPDCNSDIFFTANGEILGNCAQDLLWVGKKLFVTVSNSQKLEILDETGKRVRQYKYSAEGASPRCMATDGNKVYVTNYDGNVYVYNATTGDYITKIYSGSYPEGISYCNGSIVVNNSNWGGYGGGEPSVAIIDVASGEARIIKENVCNPYTQSVVCGGEVYIIDSGNYGDILPAIYKVDAVNAKLVKVADNATLMSSCGDYIYYANANYSYAIDGYEYSALYKMDVATGEKSDILPVEKMENIYSLDVDSETGDIYVGYKRSADEYCYMKVYSFDGQEKGSYEVGYYTSGARFHN